MSATTKTIYLLFLAVVVVGAFSDVVGSGVVVFLAIVGFAFYKDWQAKNVPTAVIVTP